MVKSTKDSSGTGINIESNMSQEMGAKGTTAG